MEDLFKTMADIVKPTTFFEAPGTLPNRKCYTIRLFPNANLLAKQIANWAASSNGGEYEPLWMIEQRANKEIIAFHKVGNNVISLQGNKLFLDFEGLPQLEIEEKEEFILTEQNY